MAQQPPTPLIVAPADGESIEAAGLKHLFKLTAQSSGGRLAVETFELAPYQLGARPHIHGSHDEYWFVLGGEITFHDGTREIPAGPGAFVAAPRTVAHGFRNAGSQAASALGLFTPAGYEEYFRDVHAALNDGEPLSDDLLARLRSRYDTVTL